MVQVRTIRSRQIGSNPQIGSNLASLREDQAGMSLRAVCALDVAAVRQHVRARDGVRLLLDVAARTMNVPMVCTARSVLMKSREDAGEGLTRDVLLLTHKERDVRTTARCASGAGDESSSCSMERHADGRSCLSVHRDAPRYWLCSSLRGRARCRSLSYVHEQQAGDEADDEPPGVGC